ncbi:hypothetical protein [Micromonospora sp. DT47]|uniref:hypothetical protein n=1 Tax=Micromonospora sp. DT47 TaxID=3393431 RepID=UPI003CE8919F
MRRRRIRTRLALSPVDWQQVEAVRRDHSRPPREVVGHAVTEDEGAALCVAEVVVARPVTDFFDDLLDEQWGPIHQCDPCQAAASA